MTPTPTPAAIEQQEKRQLYRKLLVGVLVGAVVAALGLRSLGYPLVGEGVYWLGIAVFLAIWWGTSLRLFDERDVALERRASYAAIYAMVVLLVLGASAARTVGYLGWYDVPVVVWGALYGYGSVMVVWAVAYLWLRFGR